MLYTYKLISLEVLTADVWERALVRTRGIVDTFADKGIVPGTVGTADGVGVAQLTVPVRLTVAVIEWPRFYSGLVAVLCQKHKTSVVILPLS